MSVRDYEPTMDTKNAITAFQTADAAFKDAWTEFSDRYQGELALLDKLREDRNVKLDEANRKFRDEATRLDVGTFKTVKFGAFQVSKKVGSDTYRAVEFVQLAKTFSVKKQMEDEGVIATKVEVNFDAAKEFLKKNALADKFAVALEPGMELTPAVTGPKPIPAFGIEVKGAK